MSEASKIIKDIRKSLNLTQRQFAQKIWPDKDPDITLTYISKYERGIYDPPASVFIKIQSFSKLA